MASNEQSSSPRRNWSEEREQQHRLKFEENFTKINGGNSINSEQAWNLIIDTKKQMWENKRRHHGPNSSEEEQSGSDRSRPPPPDGQSHGPHGGPPHHQGGHHLSPHWEQMKKERQEKFEQIQQKMRPKFNENFIAVNNGQDISREQAWQLYLDTKHQMREHMHEFHEQDIQKKMRPIFDKNFDQLANEKISREQAWQLLIDTGKQMRNEMHWGHGGPGRKHGGPGGKHGGRCCPPK